MAAFLRARVIQCASVPSLPWCVGVGVGVVHVHLPTYLVQLRLLLGARALVVVRLGEDGQRALVLMTHHTTSQARTEGGVSNIVIITTTITMITAIVTIHQQQQHSSWP
jgi:uncharacterized membrane protein